MPRLCCQRRFNRFQPRQRTLTAFSADDNTSARGARRALACHFHLCHVDGGSCHVSQQQHQPALADGFTPSACARDISARAPYLEFPSRLLAYGQSRRYQDIAAWSRLWLLTGIALPRRQQAHTSIAYFRDSPANAQIKRPAKMRMPSRRMKFPARYVKH